MALAVRKRLVPDVPSASAEVNLVEESPVDGMSEAFVNTLRRDYLAGADLSTAAIMMEQIPAWLAFYNAVAPHSALGHQSPQQYRSTKLTVGVTC